MTLRIRVARPDELATVLDVDDDATRLYASAGLPLGLTSEHPFVRAEQARWAAALRDGDVRVAERDGAVVGIAVLGTIDGDPYLDQLSVRMSSMRQGVGRALVEDAWDWARARGPRLWLSTYAHLPWNRPFYEKHGFRVVDLRACGPELRAVIAEQQSSLPEPTERVAMRRDR